MSEISIVLYKGNDYIYGINTKHQFVILKNDFTQVPDIATNINSHYAFCMNGSILYMCIKCGENRQIVRINLSNIGSGSELLFTNITIPSLLYMVYFNGYICATSETDIYIYHVETNTQIVQPTWRGGTYQGIACYHDKLYFKKNNTVLEIPFREGILNYSLATVTTLGPIALYFQLDKTVRYSNVVITLPLDQDMVQVGFDKTLIKDTIFSPYISLTDNTTLYQLEQNVAYIVPTSYIDTVICGTICFLSGSMVLTDQGPISIEYIIPKVHTIYKKKIIGVSMTYSLEDTLVCIEKNAISKFIPFQDTFLSNNHMIYYRGKFLEAGQLIGQKGIRHIPYENQILYNVILSVHGIMNVNNLICETLDPNNPVAKEFISV